MWNFGQISCLHFSRLACSSSIEMGTVGRWMRLHIKGQGCVIPLVSRKSYKLLSIFGPNILLRSKCFFTSWTPKMCVIDCKVCVVLLQKFFSISRFWRKVRKKYLRALQDFCETFSTFFSSKKSDFAFLVSATFGHHQKNKTFSKEIWIWRFWQN